MGLNERENMDDLFEKSRAIIQAAREITGTNIYAKEYKLYLPDKNILQEKFKQWLQEEE